MPAFSQTMRNTVLNLKTEWCGRSTYVVPPVDELDVTRTDQGVKIRATTAMNGYFRGHAGSVLAAFRPNANIMRESL